MAYGYESALKAAGAKVKIFKEFGSYQGTWIAILEDGQAIEGSYGSCSGCDSFQSEFDCWDDEQNPDYSSRLKIFGESYLAHACPLSQLISCYKNKAEEEYAWDDDKEIYNWLKEQDGK